MRERVAELPSSPPAWSRTPTTSCCSGWGVEPRARGAAAAFGVDRFHVLDTTHPVAIRRLADGLDLDRTLFVAASKSGTTLETRSHLDFFWERAGKRGAQFVGDHRPGLRARAARARARVPRCLLGRADDRRPLLRAVRLRAGAGRADGRRPRQAARPRGGDAERLPRRGRQPGPDARARARARLGGGPRQGADQPERGRLRPLGRAAARGVDRQGGQGARAGAGRDGRRRRTARCTRYASTTRTTSARSSSAGSSPPRSPARSSGSTRSTSRTSRRPRTGRARSSPPAGIRRLEPESSVEELLRRRARATTSRSRRSSIRAEERLQPLVVRARETGCVVTLGLGPRYLHSTGQLHKGGAPIGCFLQVVDDTGEELPIPGQEVRFRAPDPRPGCRRLRGVEGARPPGRASPIGGPVNLGMVGLGRMGANMTERLREHGHTVETYARTNPERTAGSLVELATSSSSRGRLADDPGRRLRPSTRSRRCSGLLEHGDIIVDGGNSNFRDSQRRAAEAAKKSVAFLDAGVSGGIWGLKEGYCVMVGGDAEPRASRSAVLQATSTEEGGYAHVGPSGAGHFVKMVHNGIEYGMMQASRRGLRDHAGLGVPGRPAQGRRALAATAPSSAAGCSTCSCSRWSRTRPGEDPRLRGGLRRGPLDGDDAIDESVPAPAITGALRTLRLAAGRVVRGEGERGAPQPVRRPRRQAGRRDRRQEDERNPLREGLRLPRTPEPCALVIFGASGDLTRRKLFPAVYSLALRQPAAGAFAIVGVARTHETDAAFRSRMKEAVAEFGRDPLQGEGLAPGSPPACATSRPILRRRRRGPADRLLESSTRSAAPPATGSSTSPSRRARSRSSSTGSGTAATGGGAGRG